MNRLFLLLLLLMAARVSAQSLGDSQIAKIEFEQRLGVTLPLDLPFRDEEGRAGPLGGWMKERPTLLVFAYHNCPNLCSIVLGSLVESLRNLKAMAGRDFQVVVVSIDPAETLAQARESKERYTRRYGRFGTEEGWHFLTGDAASIEALTAAGGFHYLRDPQSGQYAHASGVLVITPAGKISRYFLGIEYPPKELQAALTAARAEATGSLVQRLLLLCFHYAPITGRHGRAVQIAIRAAGVGTVVALIAGLWWLSRRRAHEPGGQPA
jgi:protein SCO1/2